MLGAFLKSLLGDAVPPSLKRDPAGELLAFPEPALRRLFEARYRGDPSGHGDIDVLTRAAHTMAFTGDPLPLTLDLIERAAPWEAWRRQQPTTPDLSRLDMALSGAIDAGWRLAVAHHGARLPIPPVRLARALDAAARLAAFNHGSRGAAGLLEPLVAEAAARGDAASRAALVAAFERLLAAEYFARESAIRRAEALLPSSGLRRDDVPTLAKLGQQHDRLDAARTRLFDTMGEPLAAALKAVLDGEHPASTLSLPEAVKHPALRALADLEPAERGRAFHRLLGLVDRNLTGGGETSWGELRKRGGRYHASVTAQGMPTEVGNLLGVLASRKIELVDADADVAAFLAMLRHFPLLGYKKVIELVLDTVAAHPRGRAAAALRAAVADPQVHALTDHRLRIEDVLRDLPAVDAAPQGFGRKGVGGGGPLAGLPATPLPVIDLDRWNGSEQLAAHFDNIFDARLHDAAHRDYLARLAALAGDVAAIVDGHPTTSEARARLRGFGLGDYADGRRQTGNLARAVEPGSDLHARFAALAPFVTAHPEEARALGRLAVDLGGKAQPTAKWLAEGKGLMAAVPADLRLDLLRALVATPTPLGYCPVNQDQIRTLLFLSADLDTGVLGPLLTEFALKRCYVTLPGIGIRNEKLGNACLWTLAALPDAGGVPYLARILARTKYPKIRAKVDARLNEAAAAAGIDRSTLDEMTVPTHDLDRCGRRAMPLGDGTATLSVVDGRSVAIEWRGAAGKPLKAPSVAMKADAETLKEVRAAAKELEADLAIQPGRLQRVYLDDRSWPAAIWRERYLDHPLLRALSTRLIWWVERDGARVAALPDDEGLADVDGRAVPLDDATIRLWHPIDAGPAEIEGWRDRLEVLALTQPFAQAWREVYTLTDAERATDTYSNRWAAHLLKQHQAMTLARLNGWRVTHRMCVDAPNDAPWHLTIPAHGLVADYWVEGAGGDDPEVSDSGAYTYVATDRVQFHAAEGTDSAHGPQRTRAVSLTEVPPVVFSEVMRHADLLTAVASIAADPNWLDRGGDAAHPSQWGQAAAVYWQRANTAELEESGKRRRAMLERIVPRLKIAGKLALEDRYLTVEGTRHRYRIHLGSGASFRGERHLCIVPAVERDRTRLWLPFEGDRTLSIILSKAALLAADDVITDPVILAQL